MDWEEAWILIGEIVILTIYPPCREGFLFPFKEAQFSVDSLPATTSFPLLGDLDTQTFQEATAQLSSIFDGFLLWTMGV